MALPSSWQRRRFSTQYEGKEADGHMIGSLIAAAVTVTQSFTAFAKGTASTVAVYGLVKKGAGKVSRKKK